MSSIFGHALAGLAISGAFTKGRPPRRLWAVALACAIAPDLDWFTGFLQLPAGNSFTHRGLSHSLLAAMLVATLAMLVGFRPQLRSPGAWAGLACADGAHGRRDACALGGTGVSFLWPLSDARFVCIWQPIFVSPIPLSGKLLDWLLFSLGTELVWIGVPACLVFATPHALRWLRLRWRRSEGLQ